MMKGVRKAYLPKQPPEREFDEASKPKPLKCSTVVQGDKGGLSKTTSLKNST
jgi:hypothetical protein